MNNEELAKEIKGGNDELIIVLWEQTKKLLYSFSNSAYRRYKDRFDFMGVELKDICQSCYFVFIQAIKAFDPDKKYKFTTYLEYPFKNEINALLGYRTSKKDPLNESISLETSFLESEKGTLSEIIPDMTALDFVSEIDRRSDAELVRHEVNKLPDKYRIVIIKYFFEGLTYDKIGELIGISGNAVQQRTIYALKILRKSPVLNEIHGENQHHKKQQAISRQRYNPEFFQEVKTLDKSVLRFKQDELKQDIAKLTEQLELWRKSE